MKEEKRNYGCGPGLLSSFPKLSSQEFLKSRGEKSGGEKELGIKTHAYCFLLFQNFLSFHIYSVTKIKLQKNWTSVFESTESTYSYFHSKFSIVFGGGRNVITIGEMYLYMDNFDPCLSQFFSGWI